jgi:dephospho-CoA kinase
VHALYAPGGAGVEKIAAAFPGVLSNGGIDRTKLKSVLTDEAAFAKLESIVHPLVAEEREKFVAAAAAKGVPLVVLDIPLLFEAGLEKSVDVVVVVSAPQTVQRERVLARLGMSEEAFRRLLARQLPDAQKRQCADFVVDTSRGFDVAAAEVKKITELLTARVAKRK